MRHDGADPDRGDSAEQRRLRKELGDQIQALMDANDVGGAIILVSGEAAAWRVVLPKWSLLQPEMAGRGPLRLRYKHGIDSNEQLESTLHLVGMLRDISRDCAEAFGQIFRMAKREIESKGGEVIHRSRSSKGREPS